MQEIWASIEKTLTHVSPEIVKRLRPGASETTLRRAERFMHVKLPEDAKAWYRVHNGCRGIFLNAWGLFSLHDVHIAWESMKEEMYVDIPEPSSRTEKQQNTDPLTRAAENMVREYLLEGPSPSDERIQRVWWHVQWIPFMRNIRGNMYCLDLAPTAQGQWGQIMFFQDHPQKRTTVVATSVRAFFLTLAHDLETGAYAFDETTGVLWDHKTLSTIDESTYLYLVEERKRSRRK